MENIKEANKFITKIRENEMTKNIEWTTQTIVTVAGIAGASITFIDLETSIPELGKFIQEREFGFFVDNTKEELKRELMEEINKLVDAQEEALNQIIQERDWTKYEETQIVRTKIEDHPEYDRMWLLRKNEEPIEITFKELQKFILEKHPENQAKKSIFETIKSKFNLSLGTFISITIAFMTVAIGTNGLADTFPN